MNESWARVIVAQLGGRWQQQRQQSLYFFDVINTSVRACAQLAAIMWSQVLIIYTTTKRGLNLLLS